MGILCIGGGIFISRTSFFVTWPTEPLFYVMTILTAPLIVYHNTALYNFTARFGARAVTRMESLSVPFVFMFWLFINPTLLVQHLERPVLFSVISLCVL